jgi:predicted CoA-substrate-specific enzyme activase
VSTIVAGIDAGANYTKAVLMDDRRQVLGRSMVPSKYNFARSSEESLRGALEDAGLPRDGVRYVASTGFGRAVVPFRDIQITELTCHARGGHLFFPEARTLLDVGGQTVNAIRMDERGKVKGFRLNDKCAAGTGAFLDRTARYMGFSSDQIADLAGRSTKPVTISSVCTVFAEAEVISHLTEGNQPEDIMRGAVASLVGRAVQLMRRVGLQPEYVFAGGMARNHAFHDALEQELGAPVKVLPDELGQFNGAMGAALLALQRVEKLRAEEEAGAATGGGQG